MFEAPFTRGTLSLSIRRRKPVNTKEFFCSLFLGIRLIGEGPGFKPRPSRSFIRERTLLDLNLSL